MWYQNTLIKNDGTVSVQVNNGSPYFHTEFFTDEEKVAGIDLHPSQIDWIKSKDSKTERFGQDMLVITVFRPNNLSGL